MKYLFSYRLTNPDIVKFFWVVLFLCLSLVPETDKIFCDIVGWWDLDPLVIARSPLMEPHY